MSGERDSYRAVCVAARPAIAAVLADPAATEGELRVLLAIVHEVALFSRLSDHVTRQRLADLAGVSERTVSRAVTRLVEAGAVEWRPGRRGVASVVAFPAGHLDVPPSDDPAGHLDVPQAEKPAGHLDVPPSDSSGTKPAVQRDTRVSHSRVTEKTNAREAGRNRTTNAHPLDDAAVAQRQRLEAYQPDAEPIDRSLAITGARAARAAIKRGADR